MKKYYTIAKKKWLKVIYNYIRKSRQKQLYQRQLNIMKEKGYINGVNCKYILETYTGTAKHRPELDNLINILQENDTIIVESLSRLSRGGISSTFDLINQLLYVKKVNVIILKEGFNLKGGENMDASTKLLLGIFATVSEFERDLLSERTKEGMKATKKKVGRPTQYNIKDFINTLDLNANGLSVNESIKLTKYPKSSFIKNLSMLRLKYNIQDKKELVKTLKEANYE